MSNDSLETVVKELHRDLVRKYERHHDAVGRYWRSFDANQRASCMKAGAKDAKLLEHPLDRALGSVCKFIPEWNLRDIARPGSDALLDLLDHRTSRSLYDQYYDGLNGGKGDANFILDMIHNGGLRLDQTQFPGIDDDCYMRFTDGQDYGTSIRVNPQHRGEVFAWLASALDAGYLLRQSTGILVLLRQQSLLGPLNIIIDDILAEGSKTRSKEAPSKPDDGTLLAGAMSSYSLSPEPEKTSLQDLAATAADQKASHEEYLDLLSSYPVVLVHDVNFTFYSRPELIADEKGNILPAHTDKYISGAVFDSLHNAVKRAAIWNYLGRLIELLESNPEKAFRPIILRELSSICHLEYNRAQAEFKRQVRTATGAKWFVRLSHDDGSGNPVVRMKAGPEQLAKSDTQLCYMLHLCQPDTTASKAVNWVDKLSELHEAHPSERERLVEREARSLAYLAVIIGFIHDATPVVSMPSFSGKSGKIFSSRIRDLDAELNQLRKEVDLLDYASPIDNLLEPGMAQGALDALDQFMKEKAGTKIGFLYKDLVEDCLTELENQCQQAKAKSVKVDCTVPPVLSIPEKQGERVEQRREKEKTRPLHSSVYKITPETTRPKEPDNVSAMTFNVSSKTAQIFSTLFMKDLARGSVSWASFTAAMAELGFLIIPKSGSVYKFVPPPSMAVQKPLTLHRPHKSHIEGYLILIFAQRLKRTYGWTEQTFVTSWWNRWVG